jgi:outer membrane protein assembly factor BamB
MLMSHGLQCLGSTSRRMPILLTCMLAAVAGCQGTAPNSPDRREAASHDTAATQSDSLAPNGTGSANDEASATLPGGETTVAVSTAASNAAPQPEIITDPQLWPSEDRWPLGRGSPLATGIAASRLPDHLEVVWKFAAPEGAFESTPIIADGVVYIGCLNGYLYALDLQDGSEKWSYKTELGFYAAPAIRDGLLYIGDAEGHFFCLDATSGDVKWGFEAQAEVDSGANFFEDNVLFGSQDSHLYCLNATSGELNWKFAIDDQIRCFPTVVGDRSFVAGCDSRFHIVNLVDGTEVASVDIEAPTGSAPAVGGDFAFFGTEGESVFCVNWRQAEVVWKFRDHRRRLPFRSSAALTERLAIIGGRDKLVRAFDRQTGELAWTFATRGRVDSSPVVVGERVFIGSADGRLYALSLESGEELWHYETGGGFTGAPAVAAGRLVIANDDGTVYCFGGKE